MTTTRVFQNDKGQAVQLPLGFQFDSSEVVVRREGEAVILEPIKTGCWPDNFFDRIRIEDPEFARPPQGVTPAAPRL